MAKASRNIIKDIENQLDNLTTNTDDIFLSLLDEVSETSPLKKEVSQSWEHEFALQDEHARLQNGLEDTVLSLADYLNAVQVVITETFAHSVWVKAEIRSLSAKGGHYYFELADKDHNGKITASCRGNLWRGQANKLLSKFEKNTGMSLERGLNVLLKVTANFHPQYGFSVTILDIDPTYTLGDLAQQYQAILIQLHEEGLLELNKSLPLPFDIQNVLVIAPENAAGLGDFRADADTLANTGACQFFYKYATFQGNHAPDEIRQAIITGNKYLQQKGITPDILVIIRGGGAVGDLAYLNDYELAALVAEQPIPVWVGVGHERDRVMLDEVAQISFDTPSKVIAGIRNHLINTTQTAKQNFLTIQQIAQSSLLQARRDSEQQFIKIQSTAQRQLATASQLIQQEFLLIKQTSFQQLNLAKQNTNRLRELILIQHPSRILSQGYAIVRHNHVTTPEARSEHIITSVQQVINTESITIELQDGKIEATVDTISQN